VNVSTISAPQPLQSHHRLADFNCSEPSLDDWLKRRAARGSASGLTRTYVVCDGDTVIGYYCLAAAAIGPSDGPAVITPDRRDPVAVLVLRRLAIDRDHQLAGLGTALLNDAVRRAIGAAEIAGVRALLVHAMSEQARRFYRSRGFIETPIMPMSLVLVLATVGQALLKS
jgi:GNAT superfamily N-acetyltransferase